MDQEDENKEFKIPMADGMESGEELKSQEIEDLKGEVAQLKQAVQQLTKALGERKEKK